MAKRRDADPAGSGRIRYGAPLEKEKKGSWGFAYSPQELSER